MNLSRRQLMLNAFSGLAAETPPVCMRFDLWHQDATNRGTLPDALKGSTVADLEDKLGFCRSARWRSRPKLIFPDGWVSEIQRGNEHCTEYRFPSACLYKVEHQTNDHLQAGMRGAIVKYPVSNEADCRAMLEAMEQASLSADIAGFAEYDKAIGDDGLPMLILGSCPTHALMLDWFGYEHFFYAQADFPELLEELIDALDRIYRRDLWHEAINSSAELILHGNHFADATTPPPLFRRFFLPYFQDFNSQAHRAGKKVIWHADAAMGTLLELVLEAGFDGADCLATVPLVPQTLNDYYSVWQGRIICWGGLPSTIFNPEYSMEQFSKDIHGLREFSKNKPGIIIGVSDNVMPGTAWERIEAIRNAFK